MHDVANKRVEVRLRPDHIEAVDSWREQQLGKPPRAVAVIMLMELGLRVAEGGKKPKKLGAKK
jgi:hypothetical protein